MKRIPTCHPNEPHYASGLCEHCYHIEWRRLTKARRAENNRIWCQKHKKERRAISSRWSKNNMGKVLEMQRAWRRRNPDKVFNQRLKVHYGITLKEYNALLEKQGGVCSICKSPPNLLARQKRLHTDHCHDTKKIRGLLCDRCNRGIGFFDERPDLLKNASDYLNACNHLLEKGTVYDAPNDDNLKSADR